MRGVSGVRTRRVRQDDRTRERIRAAYLINRLQDHVAGTVELSPTQVRAAEILLRKCLPDLLGAQIVDQTVRAFCVVPSVMSKSDWLRTRGDARLLEDPTLPKLPDAVTPHQGVCIDLKASDEDPAS
jgi:hypothetical protein